MCEMLEAADHLRHAHPELYDDPSYQRVRDAIAAHHIEATTTPEEHHNARAWAAGA
jgi:hypothetical protein